MSVLKSLKGTLQNVQQDISASFKSLRSKEKEIEKKRLGVGQGGVVPGKNVMFDAGADMLNRFQESWVEIHKSSEENSKVAQVIDKKASYMYLSCEHQNDNLNQMLLQVSTLPSLLENITDIMQNIGTLQAAFYEVEEQLVELENVCEVQEMQQNKDHHSYKLAAYSQLKQAQLDHIKVKFAQDHARKVQQMEAQNKATLRQKHKALDQRFQEDLKNFQLFGKPPGSTSSGSQVDLSDIKPEEDVTELNEFLSENGEVAGAEGGTVVGESASENTDEAAEVFEEDVVTSVIVKDDEDLPEDDDNNPADEPGSHSDKTELPKSSSPQNDTSDLHPDDKSSSHDTSLQSEEDNKKEAINSKVAE